jgi:hypothetical protein
MNKDNVVLLKINYTMADYKKVVEMLGDNLASFLELSKKLLIDWKVEPKKLLHTLQNLRKEDFLGLIAGTHEIKQIKKLETETKPVEKFVLFADLGEIIVPSDFNQKTWLESFDKKNRKKFYYYNDNITDVNFPKPSRILKPGDKFHVRAFKQNVPGNTTSEERMEFLATQNAVHTGAQGASLVWEQKREQLPKGYWYCSFDEKERLWKDSDGSHRVPGVRAHSDGDFVFGLGCFGDGWDGDDCLLCFCD